MIDAQRSHKVCSVCQEHKERGAYYANRSNKDGISSMCKECQGLFSTIRLFAKMTPEKLQEEMEAAFLKIARIKKVIEGVSVADIVREERKK